MTQKKRCASCKYGMPSTTGVICQIYAQLYKRGHVCKRFRRRDASILTYGLTGPTFQRAVKRAAKEADDTVNYLRRARFIKRDVLTEPTM